MKCCIERLETHAQLAAQGVPLRYWTSTNGSHEIEFLGSRDARVEPIEVKASRGSTASLNALLERGDIAQGYKLVDGNVGRDGKKVTLPHYLAPYLYRWGEGLHSSVL